MKSILLVEDDRNARYALKRILEEEGYSVTDVEGPEGIRDWNRFNLLILDLKLKNTSGIDVLKEIRTKGANIPVIVITAYANPQNIISASRYGAIDILKKPFDREELLEIVDRILKEEGAHSDTEVEIKGAIVGESQPMVEVFKKVGLAASTDMNVLLIGETGVGKDLLAEVIHENSPRKDAPFIVINCSAIPENLLEAELFGYRKGAFTGATESSKGKIELAEGGTLFLDEIGDMPYQLQSKLLRFLENRTFYRLGDDRERKADVRVIAATNRNLQDMIEANEFREDLYYRLSQIVVNVPPLRDRKEDIPLLIDFFIRKANQEFGTSVKGIREQALKKAINYDWRGNVRELKNVIYKAVLEVKEGYIDEISFYESESDSLDNLISRCINNLTEQEYKNFLPYVEKKLLEHLMEKYNGNKSKVAQVLGVSRNTLKSKLESFGI